MRIFRWMLLVGALVVLGCLAVAQRTALLLEGYALGEKVSRLHQEKTDLLWKDARIEHLTSPVSLSQLADERGLKLVAWSTLSSATAPAVASTSPGAMESSKARTHQDRTRFAFLEADPSSINPRGSAD